jgi:hypothetical protein
MELELSIGEGTGEVEGPSRAERNTRIGRASLASSPLSPATSNFTRMAESGKKANAGRVKTESLDTAESFTSQTN